MFCHSNSETTYHDQLVTVTWADEKYPTWRYNHISEQQTKTKECNDSHILLLVIISFFLDEYKQYKQYKHLVTYP
jgi:hypothetical protein